MANDGLFGCDFCKFVNWESSDDFYLYEMGSCICKANYGYEHFVTHRCILHFVVSGKGYLLLNGVKYPVHERQAFLIPEETKAYYQADSEDPWEYIWLHVGGPKLPEILHKAGLSIHQPIFTPISHWDKIISLLRDILRHPTREYYCIGDLYQIYDCMTEYSTTKIERDIDASLLHVKNVIGYIRLKYSDPIKIETIAYACGLNRSYLTRLFKEATGYTLQEYLMIYRMKMAMQQLEESEKSIQDICYAVGYSDTFTFSKAFKRHVGMSPSAYRKKHTA